MCRRDALVGGIPPPNVTYSEEKKVTRIQAWGICSTGEFMVLVFLLCVFVGEVSCATVRRA